MKLQIHTSESADEVEKYLRGKKWLETYYSTDEQEIIGDWGGRGAEMFGLKGPVTDEAFGRLVHNLHPFTGEQLTDRMRSDRRPGFDMVWNVPKSVSLTYAWTKDERIIRALRETVAEVMEFAEEQAAVRVRAGDKNRDEDRKTGWLIMAEHIHTTARPENGWSDPHLHVHLYVPNISWDPEEKKFKALQMGRIKEMADDLEKMAKKVFRGKLEALGFTLEPTKHAYEIAGFHRELIEKFSRRTLTIEATAERLGITDPAQKAKLAALTRENKIKDVKFSDFEPIWWGSLTPEEEKPFKAAQEVLNRSRAGELGQLFASGPSDVTKITTEPAALKSVLGQRDATWATERVKAVVTEKRVSLTRATRPSLAVPRTITPNEYEREAITLAAAHLFERNCVVRDYQIVSEAANNWRLQKTTLPGLWAALAEKKLPQKVKDGWRYMTTPEIIAEENRIKDRCFLGRDKFDPICPTWQIRNEQLNAGQRAAVLHVLKSPDFIMGISGDPGVGKSWVLREIREAAEARFCKFLMLAPWGTTAHETLREAGFHNAETVERFLQSEKFQQQAIGGLLVVDEAGLISNPDMDRFLALAEKLGARVVLVGDAGQLQPVGRGAAFKLLQEDGGMRTAEIKEILRQNGDYLRIVELLIAKKTNEAAELLKEIGGVCEMSFEELKVALAKDYVEAIENGETALIVAATHAERRSLMEAVRSRLKERGRLKHSYRRSVTKSILTTSEKSDLANYKPGLIIEFDRAVNGFRCGDKFEVLIVRDDMVKIRDLHSDKRKTMPLPLEEPEAFTVYERTLERDCHRDVLRNLSWTEAQKGDPEHYQIGLVVQINAHLGGFSLGEQLEVIRVSNDTVKVRNTKGQNKVLPIGKPRAFTVHEKDRIEICEGELIRITGHGRTEDGRRLSNGNRYYVDGFSYDGQIRLNNGQLLKPDFRMMDHGYALTVHASQGKTVKRVLFSQTPELSKGSSDLRQALVAITRGSTAVKLFTTNFEQVKEDISTEREHLTATELFRNPVKQVKHDTERVSKKLGAGRYQCSQSIENALPKASHSLGQQKESVRAAELAPKNYEVEEELELEV